MLQVIFSNVGVGRKFCKHQFQFQLDMKFLPLGFGRVLYVNAGSKLSYFLALKFLSLAPILKRGNTIFLMENRMGLQN